MYQTNFGPKNCIIIVFLVITLILLYVENSYLWFVMSIVTKCISRMGNICVAMWVLRDGSIHFEVYL